MAKEKEIKCEECGENTKKSILDKYGWLEEDICYCKIINEFEELKEEIKCKNNIIKALMKTIISQKKLLKEIKHK